ncbi:MAG TPA: carboxypeptidase regulatory-like domain-containing protein [Candidatus Acidoferrales bacterium]|nr:carboxypeptidase regulatory-like domain-containing protein [Candidatus Acidoferrales bacterium]
MTIRRSKKFSHCLIALAVLLVVSRATRAQVLYGSLTGNVTDASGGVVSTAKVEARNIGTSISKQVTCDDRGSYVINDLQAGTYRVTVSAPSLSTFVAENVQLDANTVRRVDAQMQVAQVSQTVTVDASAAALQTERADVGSEIQSTQVANLPLGGNRNFQTLLRLVPGSSPPAPSHSSAGNPTGALQSYVNGGADTSNSTRIDGTAVLNFWEGNIIAYVPPAEAIEAVNIVTASFDAEQGQAGGSVVNISIKSGTNTFHGAAWEYNTNSDLKARNFFYYGANNPKNILNQFGLAMGGPIVKNKLFFFADWERYMLRQSVSGLQSVPTDALRQGNFAGTGTTIYNPLTGNPDGTGRAPFANNQIPSSLLSPAAMKMAALLPLPNQGIGIANNYFGSASLQYTRDNVDIKINYNPNGKSTLFGRYSVMPAQIFDPQALGPAGGNTFDGGQPGTAPSLTQVAALGGTFNVTPHLLLDANIGFVREPLAAKNVDLTKNYGSDVLGIPGTNGPNPLQGGYPNFVINGFSSLGNPNVSNPFQFRDNDFLYAANVSWMKGSHSLRFGGEFDRYQINHFQAQLKYGVRGGFNFTGGLTALNGGAAPNAYNGWADFMLGLPQAMGKDNQYINPATVRESTYSFYVRDQWQVSRKLTIDYGARYEFYPFAARDHFGGNRYDPGTNLALLGGINGVPGDTGVDVGRGQLKPRVGVAYRLNERTVVRAGFGISSDPYYFTNMRDAYPAVISQQYAGANSYTAAGSLATGIPVLVGPNISQGSFPLPSNVGTLTFPQDFNRGYIESYNLTAQRDVGLGFNAQAAYVGTRTVRPVSEVNVNAAGPGGGNAGTPLFQKFGNANTINDQIPFLGGRYNSLQSQLTRRVKGNVLGVVYTYSRAIDYFDTENASLTWAWEPMWSRNKALAGYDRTHNFQTYAVYEVPFGHAHRLANHGIAAAIAGGWSVNTVLSRMSGTPFTVTSSGTSVNAPGNTQTADQVLPTAQILGGHGPNSPYFNPLAFAPVTAVRFGTSGRDIVRGPGFFNLDASVFRDFNVREGWKLQFRTEAYGLTNSPVFANPGATASNATFSNGAITNYNGYDIISSSTGDRQIRFALKLLF